MKITLYYTYNTFLLLEEDDCGRKKDKAKGSNAALQYG